MDLSHSPEGAICVIMCGPESTYAGYCIIVHFNRLCISLGQQDYTKKYSYYPFNSSSKIQVKEQSIS